MFLVYHLLVTSILYFIKLKVKLNAKFVYDLSITSYTMVFFSFQVFVGII